MNSEAVYRLASVGKEFFGPTEMVNVLSKVDLVVGGGESIAIHGASGSGKTTLLHIMGSLDTVSSGSILFDGQEMATMNGRQRARLRNNRMGFVFQFHHLLSEFTTLENVAMPGLVNGLKKNKAFALAEEALARVGLSHRISHRVTTLSGGERQRAAIARAILLKPRVVLADEPTGSLDEHTGQMVGELLVALNKDLGTTLVVVTHNAELAGMMQKRYELRSGELYAAH
ncbi:ABC transporter ATP-binding protein [Salidesulfovibrio onnuriiensis]|uniref:ABC transporter ATP-binding protein n=1 Tax=Salidesulfovibrio onnuriiensis TaxID=2583823 RepID=UPI0011C77D37|nr:ABC transporter ATP-binding protein [Salidesulfovibrio onnuriiensis]